MERWWDTYFMEVDGMKYYVITHVKKGWLGGDRN